MTETKIAKSSNEPHGIEAIIGRMKGKWEKEQAEKFKNVVSFPRGEELTADAQKKNALSRVNREKNVLAAYRLFLQENFMPPAEKHFSTFIEDLVHTLNISCVNPMPDEDTLTLKGDSFSSILADLPRGIFGRDFLKECLKRFKFYPSAAEIYEVGVKLTKELDLKGHERRRAITVGAECPVEPEYYGGFYQQLLELERTLKIKRWWT